METTLLRIVFTMLVTCVFSINAVAQVGVIVPKDMQGRRIIAKTDVSVMEGSPYLYDDWATGTVTFMNGTKAEQMKLKYDQLENQLHFSAENGEPQLFFHPVYEFTIKQENMTERTFRAGFSPNDDPYSTEFYEVLVDGDVKLLKRTVKDIVEQTPYGSSTKVKHIKENVNYFIAKPDLLVKIKKNKKSVLAALAKESPEIEKYIKEHNISFNDDADLTKLVAYVNSL